MLFVFAVSAAMCLQVFAGAKRLSNESRDLDYVCIEVQKVVEIWQSRDGDVWATADFLNTETNGASIRLYYDANWKRVNEPSTYVLQADFEDMLADICIWKGGEEVFAIQAGVVIVGE